MIIVALGANLPGRFDTPRDALAAALPAMAAQGITVTARSRVYLTAPVPVSDQPWFHNAAVAVETALTPFGLLEALQDIESGFGRKRTARNAPRVIDLDLVAYHDAVLDRPELIVPHPRAHERAFVLRPLADIAPGWVHPVLGLTVSQMLAALPPGQQAREDGAL